MASVQNLKQWTERVTPERASELLSKNHKFQRALSKMYVSRYVSDMKSGAWRLSPQPIVVTREGVMIDGQHRMAAVVESGTSQDFLFCEVPDESSVFSIDRGRSRNHGHILEMSGAVERGRGKRMSSIIRAMYSMERCSAKPSDFEANSTKVLAKSGQQIVALLDHVKYSNSIPASLIAALAYAYPCNTILVLNLATSVVENDGLKKGQGAWFIRRLVDKGVGKSPEEALSNTFTFLRAIQMEFEGESLERIITKPPSEEHAAFVYFKTLREKIGVGASVLLQGDIMSNSISTYEELITPFLASQMLKKVHPNQRSVSKGTVKRYSSMMKNGRWDLTPHGIIFDSDGYLVDGQHRLLAVVDSGEDQMFTVHKLPRGANVGGIDRGHIRTHGHIMEMMGVVEKGSGRNMSACLRALQCLYEDKIECASFESNSVDIFRKSGADIWKVVEANKSNKMRSSSVMAPFAYAYPCNPELVTTVLNKVAANDSLRKGTGAWHMQRVVSSGVKGRPSFYDSLETSIIVLTCLMMEFEGKESPQLRVRNGRDEMGEPKALVFFKKLRNDLKIGQEIM